MNNLTSIFIAVLANLKLVTKDEAQALAHELHTATLPDSYEAAHKLVEQVFAKSGIKSKAVTSKLPVDDLPTKKL